MGYTDAVQTEHVNQSKSPDDLKLDWWNLDQKEMAAHLWAIVNSVENSQMFLRASCARFAALYSNMEFLGLSSRLFSRTALNSFFNNRLTLNVIKSCVDTAAAKIAKNRPRPMFLTTGGDFPMQRKAKNLTKYMDGLFDEINAYEIGTKAFIDSGVFGTGIVQVLAKDGKPAIERVYMEELTIDEADGIYGTPIQMHRTKFINKETLVKMFPKYKTEIITAASNVRSDLGYRSTADQVMVRESWKIPSMMGQKDGRHVIYIENCTLFAEPWEKNYFPFCFLRWTPRLYGFWGMGLAEELTGIQLEISKIANNIRRAIHLVGVPRVWVDNGSSVSISSISNDIASVGKYSGQPPLFQVSPCMPPEVYQWLENLIVKAYNITGISQLSAQSQKPQGLNSGVALREYQDIESERFMLAGQRYEQFYMDMAKMLIDVTVDLEKSGKKQAVKAKQGKFYESINWKEVFLGNDNYTMRVFPTSILPTTPAGRLQTVQELIQSGFMSKEDALSLLDFPDLESFMSLQTAARDDIMMIIEAMQDRGEYSTPEPYMNLKMAISMIQSAYLKGRVNKVPEERLELMRRFMDEANQMLMPPAPPQGQIAPPEVQTAAPEMPPQSELIPNAPIPAQ